MFVGWGHELCGQKILWQDCGAAGEEGVVEALFVCVYFSSGHLLVMEGGYIEVTEWFARCVGGECYNWCIKEVDGDGFPESLLGLL
jgi:hypothetical protein